MLRKLSETEWRQYRAGRDQHWQRLANILAGVVACAEMSPLMIICDGVQAPPLCRFTVACSQSPSKFELRVGGRLQIASLDWN